MVKFNHRFYKAVGRLHGPWCKQPLIRSKYHYHHMSPRQSLCVGERNMQTYCLQVSHSLKDKFSMTCQLPKSPIQLITYIIITWGPNKKTSINGIPHTWKCMQSFGCNCRQIKGQITTLVTETQAECKGASCPTTTSSKVCEFLVNWASSKRVHLQSRKANS